MDDNHDSEVSELVLLFGHLANGESGPGTFKKYDASSFPLGTHQNQGVKRGNQYHKLSRWATL